jgi:hypothetical protein
MSNRSRLILAFVAGMSVVAVPAAVYLAAYVRDWDRAWGYR